MIGWCFCAHLPGNRRGWASSVESRVGLLFLAQSCVHASTSAGPLCSQKHTSKPGARTSGPYSGFPSFPRTPSSTIHHPSVTFTPTFEALGLVFFLVKCFAKVPLSCEVLLCNPSPWVAGHTPKRHPAHSLRIGSQTIPTVPSSQHAGFA